jgi:hypothetical protein
MIQIETEYLAAGGNRHPSAADWDISGLLAFGANRNVALWRPQVSSSLPWIQNKVGTVTKVFCRMIHIEAFPISSVVIQTQ